MAIPPAPGRSTSPVHKAGRSTPKHRHTWLHRLLVTSIVFVALCVLAAGGGLLYIKYRLNQLQRFSGCLALVLCGHDDPGQPMNVLLVGSDTRANISPAERAKFGNAADVGGERTDTMMVLHVDPHAAKASVLSIPRDLYVKIAGTTHTDRINTAYGYTAPKRATPTTAVRRTTTSAAFGAGFGATTSTSSSVPIKDGAERLIATIRQDLGIDINHYVEVDFNGFRAIVNAVNGVTVPFAAPARDAFSGLNIKTAGCIQLTGDQALSYVRARHYEYFEAGHWRSDPTGDIGRIQRQQDFIRRMLRQAISRGIRNPLKLNALIGAGIDNVKLDGALSTKDIVRIGKQFRSLEPESVDMLTIPATGANIGGASVLLLKKPEAQAVIDRFSNAAQVPATQPPKNVFPAEVRVRVLNGTGTPGLAGATAQKLTASGFVSGGIGDAAGFDHTTTNVHYGAGQLGKAQLLQSYVVGGAQLVSDPTLKGGDLTLVLGSAFGGVRAAPVGASGVTTTAPSTTSTTRGTLPSSKGATNLSC